MIIRVPTDYGFERAGEDIEHADSPEEIDVESFTLPIAFRRPRRTITAPTRYSPSLYYLLLTDNGERSCYEEAIQVAEKNEWKSAMDDEMVPYLFIKLGIWLSFQLERKPFKINGYID
ncbi:hypothetical protein KSP39_PZI021447 [Platanthera zijinensis]|uniref:Uncharacterized protein n=1 Tax=Platanthera zijinensis TaxID=2320716 RepID=A0AAP0AYW6_9ASPA